MLFKSKCYGQQDACDADVADNRQKPQTTSECASEEDVENTKQKASVQSTENQTRTEKVTLINDGAQGIDDVDGGMSGNTRQNDNDNISDNGSDDDDDDDYDDDGGAETGVEQCGKAETQLSEAEQEKDRVKQETEEHITAAAAEVEPTTEHAERKPESCPGSTAGNDTATTEPVDLVSEEEHLSSIDGEVMDRDSSNYDVVRAQSQVKSDEQKTNGEKQENLSQNEKRRDDLGKQTGYSETVTNSAVADAANLHVIGDSDKPVAVRTKAEDQSQLREESKKLRISAEIQEQTECDYSEAVQAGKDDAKPVSGSTETQQHGMMQVQSYAGDTEYVAAAVKVQERLKTATDHPHDNSLLNCLRFYTREEHLDEYYCLACNEGWISCHRITVYQLSSLKSYLCNRLHTEFRGSLTSIFTM